MWFTRFLAEYAATFSLPELGNFCSRLLHQLRWYWTGVGTWQPRPVFSPLPPPLLSLNLRIAKHVFARLEIPALPALLERQLKEHDARYALAQFFRTVGIPYREIRPGAKRRPAYLRQLRTATDLILRTEKIAHSTPLSPEPIFAELAYSMSAAEDLFRQFGKAAEVWRGIEEAVTAFPVHRAFKETVQRQLAEWPHLSTATLAEAVEINQAYLRLQAEFRRLQTDLHTAIERLLPLVTSDAELHEILHLIATRIEALGAAIRAGTVDPSEGIAGLQDLLNDCEAMADTVADPETPETEEELRERYCLVLGVSLSAMAAEIRKAYIRLVKKVHPDLNPHDPDAATKFQDIQQAYEALMRMTDTH